MLLKLETLLPPYLAGDYCLDYCLGYCFWGGGDGGGGWVGTFFSAYFAYSAFLAIYSCFFC